MMYTAFKKALRLLMLFTIILGLAYPLAVTALANLFFPVQANGSLITENNRIIGSTLLGQSFVSDKYFQARPSAVNYNPLNAGGSNLGPSNDKLIIGIKTNTYTFTWKNYLPPGMSVPSEMVMASGSGLDPHISPKAAYAQVQRVAEARGMSSDKVMAIVNANVEEPLLGLFGTEKVNILKLNVALEKADTLAKN